MTVPASEACDVTIVVASAGYWRPEKGWRIGRVVAFAAGQRATYTKNHGWRCQCGATRCGHVAAISRLIDPDLLTCIREGRRHRPEWRLDREKSSTVT